jgi:hypothetical protein
MAKHLEIMSSALVAAQYVMRDGICDRRHDVRDGVSNT